MTRAPRPILKLNRTVNGKRMGRKPKTFETGHTAPTEPPEKRPRGRPKKDGPSTLDIVRSLRTPRSGNAERARDIDAKASREHKAGHGGDNTPGEGAAEKAMRKRGRVKVKSVKRRHARVRRYVKNLTGIDRGEN